MPSESLFIENDEPATASVSLKLRRGKWLTKDQIQGIVFLVSSSVSKLSPENVTIVDNNGKLLAGFQDSETNGKRTYDQLEFQTKKERNLENRIKTMLETVLGEDKAIVRVSCDLDFIEQEKTEEMFFPDNQVVRSEQLFSESSNEAPQEPEGIPGLATNITQETIEGGEAAGSAIFRKQDATRNYEIGKVTSRQILPTGKLNRLSVAVIVDGTYKEVTVGEGEEAKQEVQYIPRTTEEMTKLENIVMGAVNYDQSRGDKIEVVNIAFGAKKAAPETDEVPGLFSRIGDYASYIKYIASGIFLLFTFLFIVRPLISWLTSDSIEDFELLEQLPKTISELEREYEEKGESLPFTEQAALLISQNEEHSAELVQSWLNE
jgi:flagellar M-ring protein FliF